MKKINQYLLISLLSVLAACATQSRVEETVNALHQNWQLEQATIDGQPLDLQNASVTLTYQEGRLAGRSAINRYSGPVIISNKNIRFSGPMIMTRMAGPENLMEIEDRYLSSLVKIESYDLQDNRLEIFSNDKTTDLIFTKSNPESH